MKNNNIFVSVLMTSYNREKYIADAIKSVLASSYTNFELIIVDDCSKDKTVEIAKSFEKTDNRIKVFVNEKNLGDYPNRNKAASYAKGKYLKYVDADDLIYPWGLEILVNCMEKFPEADWGLCSFTQFSEKPFPIFYTPSASYAENFLRRSLFHKAPLSSIIKKEIFDKVGGFKPYRMVGDFEMWHRLALQFPLIIMLDGVVWYREHGEQEANSIKKYNQMYETIRMHYLTHSAAPISFVQRQKAIKKLINNSRKNIILNIIKLNFKELKTNVILNRFYKNYTHISLPEQIS